MKPKVLLIILPLFVLASCNLFKSDENKRRENIMESLKYINEGDSAKFLGLFAENNFIEDTAYLMSHFALAKTTMAKYGIPAESAIQFLPIEGGMQELGTRGKLKIFQDAASTEAVKAVYFEYVFLNDNPEAGKFLEFRIFVVE